MSPRSRFRERSRTDRASWLTPRLAVWIIASAVSSVAGSVVGFGLAWTATGLGADSAGTVLMLWSAPLLVFSLVGGVLGDRWGHRRMLVTANLAQLGVVGVGGPVVVGLPESTVVLALFAAGLGTVQALRTPSALSAVRLFVDDEQLTPALAATATLTQVLTLSAPAVAGVVVSLSGLAGCLAILVVAAIASSVAYAAIRPPFSPEPPAATPARQQALEGLSLITRSRRIRLLLVSLALVAGAMLPLLTVMVPLVARDRVWTAAQAGLMASGWTAGSLLVGVVVSSRRSGETPRSPLIIGPSVSALGCLLLAVAPWPWLGIAGMVVLGAGVRTYTTAAAPRLLTLAPRDMVARLQSILLLVQQGAVLIMVGALGLVSEHLGVVVGLEVAAGLALSGGVVAIIAAEPGDRVRGRGSSTRNGQD